MRPAIPGFPRITTILLVVLPTISMASPSIAGRIFAGLGVFADYVAYGVVAVCTLAWLIVYRHVSWPATSIGRHRWLLLLPFVTCYPAWLVIWIIDATLRPHQLFP